MYFSRTFALNELSNSKASARSAPVFLPSLTYVGNRNANNLTLHREI